MLPNATVDGPIWRRSLERLARQAGTATAATAAGALAEGGYARITDAASWLATPEYQCSRIELSVRRDGRIWRRPLPCRTWRCTFCARRLRSGIMQLAASGQPTRMLTLTCSPTAEPDAALARQLLHRSWRALRLKIARELAKPPGERWRARLKNQANLKARGLQSATGGQRQASPPSLQYFAVVERHKSGRPHLHILLRCDFIPQAWLSAEMNRLAGSPIVDIRPVHGTKQAAAYVAKYIGKAPARFGSARSYWYTRDWAPPSPNDQPNPTTQQLFFSTRRANWSETVAEVEWQRPVIDVTADGWFSTTPRASPFGAVVVHGRFAPIYPRDRAPPTAAPDPYSGDDGDRW